MAVQTRVATVGADAWFASPDLGNGKGNRMGVGHGTAGSAHDRRNRFAIRIPRGTLFDGITEAAMISAFRIRLQASTDVLGIGSNPVFYLERGTTGFAENDHSDFNTLRSGTGNGVWPGPTRTQTNRVKWNGAAADQTWITVNMLDLGREWFAHPEWTTLTLVAVAADGASSAYDEDTSTRRIMFYSADSANAGNRPYAELVFDVNKPPNIATDLSPTGGAVSASTAGTSLAMTARHTDPNGDPATEDQFEVYSDAATDAVLGTRLKLVHTIAATAHNTLRSRTATLLPARTFLKWRVRFRDPSGVWGAWSLLQRAKTAYLPSAPTNIAVTPGTVDPDVFASLVSGDPADFITAAEVNVYQDPATGSTITKWASGKQTIGGSSNRLQMDYSGSPLQFGQTYRAQIFLWNRDDVRSPASAFFLFTPREPSGPIITPGDRSTKIDTRTPTFILEDPGGAEIDQHRVRWYSPAGALLRDTGIVTSTPGVSKSIDTPSGLFDWGQDPMVDAAIRLAGNVDMGPFAERVTIHINAAPGAPYPLTVETAGAIRRLDDVWIIDAATPTIRIPYRDTDRDLGYVENPTRREVEIETLAGVPLSGSPFIATSGITELYVTPTLTAETTYRIRARYDDSAGVRSEWSEYLILKRSAAPTLSAVTPADGVTLTDPTPTIAWTYASSGGKTQASYRVTLAVAGSTIYDSGARTDGASSFKIPAGILPDDTSVVWSLEVLDTDGLSQLVERDFTTNFTQPATLTGLTATPDTDAKAIALAWTASALSDAEFDAYLVYAKAPGGPWELVATLTDKATPAYLYRGAEHNGEVQFRVTQTNGWMESEPVEASALLTVEGFWWLRPEPLELRYVTPGDFSRAPKTRHEELEPLAGGVVVLTWGTHGSNWTLRVRLRPENRAAIAALEADMKAGVVGILKTPRSQAFYSKLLSVPETYREAGYTEITITGREVGREAATF